MCASYRGFWHYIIYKYLSQNFFFFFISLSFSPFVAFTYFLSFYYWMTLYVLLHIYFSIRLCHCFMLFLCSNFVLSVICNGTEGERSKNHLWCWCLLSVSFYFISNKWKRITNKKRKMRLINKNILLKSRNSKNHERNKRK